MRFITCMCIAILAFMGVFAATAFAAGAVTPEDSSLLDLLSPVRDAFANGQYLYAGMLALILVVAALKRYAPEKYGISAFVHGDVGGTLLTLAGSFAGAMAATLGGGESFSWAMPKTALLIAVGAAGGYTMIKRLIVAPIQKSAWFAKSPAWVKGVLGLVFWIFDRPSPIAVAEAEGDKAVAAHPAKGRVGFEGKITEIK